MRSTPLHLNAILASVMLFVLALVFMFVGERCAAAAIAASIGTVAMTFARLPGNGHVVD